MRILKFLQNKLNKKINQTEKIEINKNLSCFDINIKEVKIKKIDIK
jgi:hypothetical protein